MNENEEVMKVYKQYLIDQIDLNELIIGLDNVKQLMIDEE